MEQASNSCRRVLIFNSLKRLVSIAQSAFAVAKANDWNISSIRCACSGKTVSYHNLYFRYLDDDIEVSVDDLGVLDLVDYDKLRGVERKVYPNKNMSRENMKYDKRPREKSPYYPFKHPQNDESQNNQ